MNQIEPFDGLTIVYADKVDGHSVLRAAKNKGFGLIITEQPFHETPQSTRIEWCEGMWEFMKWRTDTPAILTNDYYLIRMMEYVVPENRFRIYHMDTGVTVSKFVDLKPNPTLENGEFLFRVSVKAALKVGKKENPQNPVDKS